MTLRDTADQIIRASLRAVQPDAAVQRALQDFSCAGRVVLIAIGTFLMIEKKESVIPQPKGHGWMFYAVLSAVFASLTTILGLIVMAFGNNVGTALMQPVALVCIGGLLYATLMTLLVVPCMYDILSRRDLRKVDEEELKLLDM